MCWVERSLDGVSGVLECLIGKGYNGDMSGDVSLDFLDTSSYLSPNCGDMSVEVLGSMSVVVSLDFLDMFSCVSPNCGDMSSYVSLDCGDMSSYVGYIS